MQFGLMLEKGESYTVFNLRRLEEKYCVKRNHLCVFVNMKKDFDKALELVECVKMKKE